MARVAVCLLLTCLCGAGFVAAAESSSIMAWSAAPWLNGGSSGKVRPANAASGGLEGASDRCRRCLPRLMFCRLFACCLCTCRLCRQSKPFRSSLLQPPVPRGRSLTRRSPVCWMPMHCRQQQRGTQRLWMLWWCWSEATTHSSWEQRCQTVEARSRCRAQSMRCVGTRAAAISAALYWVACISQMCALRVCHRVKDSVHACGAHSRVAFIFRCVPIIDHAPACSPGHRAGLWPSCV